MSRLWAIAALLLMASGAVGQPVVSGVSGEIVRNGSITISGEGFGIKGVPAPVAYEDFQSFYAMVDSAGEDDWVTIMDVPFGSSGIDYVEDGYADGHSFEKYLRNSGMKGAASIVGGSADPPPSRYDGDTAMLSPYGWGAYDSVEYTGDRPIRGSNKGMGIYRDLFSKRWYVSWWGYRHAAVGTDHVVAGNSKLFANITGPQVNGYPGIRHDIAELHNSESPGGRNLYDCEGHAWGTDFRESFIGPSLRWNEHARFDCYIEFENPGKYWANYGGEVLADSVYGGRSYEYDDEGCPGLAADQVWIGNFFSTNGAVGASTDGYLDIYHSEVYIDTTQARVEIGDAEIWNDCVHREILLPTGWSATSITATLNDGLNGETTAGRQFVAGELAYIYVIHRNGDVNAEGYPVTIGGTVAPGAPGQPQNVTATEID